MRHIRQLDSSLIKVDVEKILRMLLMLALTLLMLLNKSWNWRLRERRVKCGSLEVNEAKRKGRVSKGAFRHQETGLN